MTGWIIYSKNDIEKNKIFVEMLKRHFGKYLISLNLIILEEMCDIESYEMPDFAINRSRDYKIAEMLEKREVRVFNNSKVTKIANDKAKTYEYIKDIVPFMPVLCDKKVIISDKQKDDDEFQYPYVIKTCRGHGGNQVFMVENLQQEKEVLQSIRKEKYIVQQVCSDLGKDVRVYVLGNKIVEAVLRTSSESFKSNYSLGGCVQKYALNQEEKKMVYEIVDRLSLDYAGIDFTFHNGKAVFNEIEDAVGARMLYEISKIDIVEKFSKYIIGVLKVH